MELEVVSKTGKAQCLDYQLYNFLSDFNNIAQILPAEHRDKMECTADTCTINAQAGMSVTLEFIEREPYKLLKLGAVMGKDFYIWIQLKQVDAYDTRVRMTIKAEMNMLMRAMAKKKLQEFADAFVNGICQIPAAALQMYANK